MCLLVAICLAQRIVRVKKIDEEEEEGTELTEEEIMALSQGTCTCVYYYRVGRL